MGNTGGVPHGFVLGLLLLNLMYDGLIVLHLSDTVKLVAFVDDVDIEKKKMGFTIREHNLQSQPSNRSHRVMIDTRLTFNEHSTVASREAFAIRRAFTGIKPKIENAIQNRRLTLRTVVMSILLYGVPSWAHMTKSPSS